MNELNVTRRQHTVGAGRLSVVSTTVCPMNDLVSLISELPEGLLPAGRVVSSSEDDSGPAFWLSDQPAPPGSWSRLRAESGLWPLLLRSLDRGQPERPWEAGEIYPAMMTPADQHDAAARMQNWWQEYTEWEDSDYEQLSEDERAAVTAPFGRDWPGLCPAIAPQGDPEHFADQYAEHLKDDGARLGLVAVERGSDALWVTGWSGPVNYENDSGVIAAVIRSWEDRFGARVVGMGFATLELSVAAPPTSMEQALRVAAEHFALCPDSVWQSCHDNLEKYAASILNQNGWSFWWD